MKLEDKNPIVFNEKNDTNWFLWQEPDGVWDPTYVYRSLDESSVYYRSREYLENDSRFGYIAFKSDDFIRFKEDFVRMVNTGTIDDSSYLYYEVVNLAPTETHGEGKWLGYPLPLLFDKKNPDYFEEVVEAARERVLRDLRALDFPV